MLPTFTFFLVIQGIKSEMQKNIFCMKTFSFVDFSNNQNCEELVLYFPYILFSNLRF